jgi:hypothetical protein
LLQQIVAVDEDVAELLENGNDNDVKPPHLRTKRETISTS